MCPGHSVKVLSPCLNVIFPDSSLSPGSGCGVCSPLTALGSLRAGDWPLVTEPEPRHRRTLRRAARSKENQKEVETNTDTAHL